MKDYRVLNVGCALFTPLKLTNDVTDLILVRFVHVGQKFDMALFGVVVRHYECASHRSLLCHFMSEKKINYFVTKVTSPLG